jgi:hypothetical protein
MMQTTCPRQRGAHRRRHTVRRVLAAALIAPLATASAHHGFGGRYDTSQPVLFTGEVTSARVGMPHPVITLRLKPAALKGTPLPRTEEFQPRLAASDAAEVTIEFPPVRLFLELGDRLAPGSAVRVIAYRNCLPPHQWRGQWIQWVVSGEVVVRSGRMQSEVVGCER